MKKLNPLPRRTILAGRIQSRAQYVFGVGISVVAIDDGHFRFTCYKPHEPTREEVVAINPDEYAKVFKNKDDRDIFIDRIIQSFLERVQP